MTMNTNTMNMTTTKPPQQQQQQDDGTDSSSKGCSDNGNGEGSGVNNKCSGEGMTRQAKAVHYKFLLVIFNVYIRPT